MSEEIEYVFFTRSTADRFCKVLADKKLDWIEEVEAIHEEIVLKISDGVDDDLWDELDDTFDELSENEQALLEADDESNADISASGIYIQLKDGEQTIAKVNPAILGKVMSVLDNDELNEFVESIVQSVENPDDSPICESAHDVV